MNIKLLKTTAILLILAGCFSSCSKQEQTLNDIDSEINIRMVEIFDKSPRTFQFVCSTEKIYPCCNYSIKTESRQSSKKIDVSFKGVIEHYICLTAIGPATAYIDLGALSEGTYNLNLSYGDVKQSGQLLVSSDSYKVNFRNKSAFKFTNAPLNKIPEHTIWGNICYHTKETSSLVQSFVTALTKLGAEKKPYLPGNYNEFEIDKNGNIVQPGENSGCWFAQSFIFHFSGNVANIEQLVKQYARDYGTEYMYISIYTEKGEKLLSWMY